MKVLSMSLLSVLVLAGCVSTKQADSDECGRDVLRVFQQAHAGKPLRCVAIGGSITQAGKGWIGDWLRETFPNSNVAMHNAGMSATGSMLGMFRLERDVISCQPDLVLIEFAVNDGGGADETVYWTLESIVRRLKSLPNPPAIVFLQAASENQSKIYRHSKIAQHYNLLEVNLQTKTDAFLKKHGYGWEKMFGDAVHPHQDGHKQYTKFIVEDLKPLADRAKKLTEPVVVNSELPPQFSPRKLILDGRMVPIAVAPGWHEESSLPFWWNKFFYKIVAAKEAGTTMKIPFRGTTAGLFYALDKSYGVFYANVDDTGFKEVICNSRGGYTYTVFKDLTPEEHCLNIVLPKTKDQGKGVKLGYLMLGGETGAAETIAEKGAMTLQKLADFRMDPIKASQWQWIGPFGDVGKKWPGDDKLLQLKKVFGPESQLPGTVDVSNSYQTVDGRNVKWQPVTLEKLDLATMTGFKDRGICYATTTLDSDTAGPANLVFRVDYWGKVWINGKLVLSVDKGHGSPHAPIFFDANLKKGKNEILVKVQSGSLGNNFSLEVVR